MPVSRSFPAVILVGLLVAAAPVAPGLAADRSHAVCLSKAEQRAAIESRKAVPLARAIRSLHARGRRGEVVRAALCRHGDRLVYELTLLARNGKVFREAIDAADGELINGR